LEGKRFDDLSRAVAGMASRRGVVRGIVGGAIAGLIGGIGLRDAEAGRVKRAPGDICRKPDDCESNVCEPDGSGRSRCACTTGSVLCNGACCQTLCDTQMGCLDPFVHISCYESCEANICFGTNNYFNFNYTNTGECQQLCANECWAIS
jgi:hypothetical protein